MMSKENNIDEVKSFPDNDQNPTPAEGQATNPLEDIAYFVIMVENTKVLDEAVAIIPNDIAKKAVIEAINSILIPVKKADVEAARAEQEKVGPEDQGDHEYQGDPPGPA